MEHDPLALIKTFLPEQAAVAAEKAVAHLPAKRRLSSPLVPLGQFPDPKPEEENPAALFKRGWLRKGGGAFIVAPSGVGKSVFTVQAAICWSLGKAAFGVEPVRPLKIAVIQAEDDREEVGYFRNCVTRGLVDEFGFSEADIRFALGWDDPSTARVFFHKAVGKCGQAFVEEVGALLDERPDIDLVIVNPFQSYFGGDVNKNNELSAFFRMWLDPEIKDPGDGGNDRAAVMFMHHTNKPPNVKEREGWGVDMFAAYIGAGGAEIVNWARAILSLMPTRIPGMFRLCAGKRGQRLGWEDVSGKTSYCKVLKHAENGNVYWREGTPEDERELGLAANDGDGGKEKADGKADRGMIEMLHAVVWDPGHGPYHYADVLCTDKEEGGLGGSRQTARNYLFQITEGDRRARHAWVQEKVTDFGSRFYPTEEGLRAAMVYGARLDMRALFGKQTEKEAGF
ncbi:MAG TPA: AAA family ATPase [Kiritimatiellia bacterium]|nr:AAA family ATPase [Kiritimatiellia bacterium]